MKKIIYDNNARNYLGLVEIDDISKGDFINLGHTAFIGRLLEKDDPSLFLVTFGQIALADHPSNTWSGCQVFINKWVDVEIKVIS
jgi:hypothetical protein